MDISLTLQAIENLFAYPFRTRDWTNKFLIGSALIFASFIIPLIPLLPVLGYLAEIIRRNARGEAAELPEWNNWSKLFLDGLRLFAAYLILSLPAILVALVDFALYFIFVFGFMIQAASAPSGEPSPMALFFPFVVGIIILLIFVAVILGDLAMLLQPAALAHVSVTGSLRAFFTGRWWRVMKSGLGGFFVTVFILLGLFWSFYMVYGLLYITMVFCFILPILLSPAAFYSLLLFGLLDGQAYREGLSRLEAKEAGSTPAPSAPAENPAA